MDRTRAVGARRTVDSSRPRAIRQGVPAWTIPPVAGQVVASSMPVLLDLNHVQCSMVERHYAGLQTVDIGSIRGSEGRCHDFDRDFLPLNPTLAQRWTSVFVAIQQGIAMPPVKLILSATSISCARWLPSHFGRPHPRLRADRSRGHRLECQP